MSQTHGSQPYSRIGMVNTETPQKEKVLELKDKEIKNDQSLLV